MGDAHARWISASRPITVSAPIRHATRCAPRPDPHPRAGMTTKGPIWASSPISAVGIDDRASDGCPAMPGPDPRRVSPAMPCAAGRQGSRPSAPAPPPASAARSAIPPGVKLRGIGGRRRQRSGQDRPALPRPRRSRPCRPRPKARPFSTGQIGNGLPHATPALLGFIYSSAAPDSSPALRNAARTSASRP